MKKDLEALLYQRYPLIFAERDLPMTETCMCWGITCGDGWFDLLDTLCERLQFWTEHNHAPQVIAVQVKEKFGGLRFYTHDQISAEQRGMIWLAEAMSFRICDQCGQPGQQTKLGRQQQTRCKAHAVPDSTQTA